MAAELDFEQGSYGITYAKIKGTNRVVASIWMEKGKYQIESHLPFIKKKMERDTQEQAHELVKKQLVTCINILNGEDKKPS